MADNFDLASVLQSATEASSASASFGQLALQTGNLLAGIQADKSREAKEVAGAASIIDEQANLAKMQQEQTRIRIANRMGINANDSSWMIGKLGDEVKSNYAIMQEANKVIGEKQSINFLENPLGYLHGQLTVNSDIARYNAASSARETAFNTAGQLEKVGQDSFLTNNALVETVNQSTINASKIVAGHKYLVEANDAASQGLRDNLAGVQIAANQSVQQAQLQFESNTAIMREKAYQVSLEHLRLDQARFSLQKAAAEAGVDEDTVAKKFLMQGFFNQTGGKELEGEGLKTMLAMYKKNDPQMQLMFQSGMDSYRVSPGGAPVPIISLSPFRASQAYELKLVQNLPLAQTQVLDSLVQLRKDFSNQAVQIEFKVDKADKNSYERGFNAYVKQQKDLGNPEISKLYTPMSLDKVAAANPAMAALPLWQKVLAPAAGTGVDISNPKIASSLTIGALAEGKITYNDALGLQVMYSNGLKITEQSRNFIAMGMPPPTDYNVKVASTTFGSTDTLNIVDARSWATHLNKSIAQQAAIQGSINARTNLFGGTQLKSRGQ